ncbi:hypothetical protein SPB21_29555 [Leptothoe sp. ISB3NOV94-8A]
MQFQLIQNFLDLPGIIGFSLVPLNDTSNHAYSVGFPQGNGPDKNPLLLQGIQQIIKTTPTSLEFCAFQFGSYQVELHKVESGAVLLVFSEGALSSQYSKSVSELMQFIKADYLALVESIQSIHADNVTPATTFSAQRQTASVDDVVAAMNSLSQVTSRYLGTQLVANQWRTYQSQDMVWLKKFCISVDGTISVKDVDSKLSPEQLTEIRLWTQRFHQRCTRIIRDYDVLVEQTLPKEHWQLLFGG